MNKRQTALAVSFLHASEFAAGRRADFVHDPARKVDEKYAEVIGKLNAVITELGGKQAIQSGTDYHEQTGHQENLRQQLEEEISDAAHTAGSITEETGQTALQAHFRLPYSHGDSTLTATARSMAAAIRTHGLTAAFESHGWPGDAAKHLETLAKNFELSEGGQGNTLGKQVEATAAIPDILHRGRAAIHTLTSIFRRIYKTRPEVLAGWKSASHIEKSSKTPAAPPTPAEPAPPGTAVPPSASGT